MSEESDLFRRYFSRTISPAEADRQTDRHHDHTTPARTPSRAYATAGVVCGVSLPSLDRYFVLALAARLPACLPDRHPASHGVNE